MTTNAAPGHAGRVLGPDATVAAFPLGGIGTGNVSLGARGEFRDWELANLPAKGTTLPFSFFAIHAASADGSVTRVLESRLPGPHEGDQGYDAGRLAGLPRLAGSRMRGEYPIVTIEFEDDELPVEVTLTAFTPLVPLDADDSGIPGAVLRYTVRNPGSQAVDVTIAGSLSNPVGITGWNVFHFPEYAGQPTIGFDDDGTIRGLRLGSDLDGADPRSGTVALTTADSSVTAKPQWLSGFWQDGVQVFWDDLSADGRLEVEERFSIDEPPYPGWFTRLRTGSLGIVHTLAPGETREFEFQLAWHFPNRRRAWEGNIALDNANAVEIVRNHYATRYADAWQAARDLVERRDELEGATREFHDVMFDGTLPAEVVDATTATLVAARSTTCFRLEDGTPGGLFAAWEGSFDHAGSCEGTCTHVWNYAQTLAQLFPELERSARRTEFLHETRDDGRMNFRANSVFGNAPWDFHPAADGQLGAVVRLYREWRQSGDDAFLAELWPAARRAVDFAFAEWDSDGDGVLDSRQHNTYDIEFFGPNSLSNSLFFAALTAAARMADHLGDRAVAERYRLAAAAGAERMDALLFNGEYYEQRLDDVDERRYQYGTGCLSDQVFGQLLAHVSGLGRILPEEHVRSAVAAVYRHNFRTDLTRHRSVQRTYALNDEAGLVLCSWPNGGRPRIPFVYSDEIWTGIEYQVATHLVYEGLVDEGLELVRAVRDRHDGRRRNPWNEVECGNHYARSLASWGLVLALTGADVDTPARRLGFAPAAAAFDDGALRTVFTTGSAWGELSADVSGVTLRVLGGRLEVDELTFRHPGGDLHAATGVHLCRGETVRLAPASELITAPSTHPSEETR